MQKMAMIQHPMWLIIKEDESSAEATPPWGATDLDEYAERIGRNLAIIENDPRVKLNYEFGAYELEDLVDRYPELYDRMKAMVAAGRLFFVNGSYNQPHGHVLSLEANIRHLETGIRSIRELFGVEVITHAVQEPDYSNQTPQILRALGFEFAWYGGFIHDLITPFGRGPQPSLLYRWKGLDGTSIPLMSAQNGMGINLDRREPAELRESDGFVFVKAPDLEEFDVDPGYEYVALDHGLEEQRRACLPEVDARLQVPWSYVEGTDGETLFQSIYRCERTLIALDAAGTLMDPRYSVRDTERLWKRWLQGHHHDAAWHGAPILREKSRQWCIEVESEARERLESILGGANGIPGGRLCLFTSYPSAHRGVVRVRWPGRPPGELITDGVAVTVQVESADGDGADLLVPFEADGCGIRVFDAAGDVSDSEREKVTGGFTYENRFYRADVSAYGGLERVYASDGRELFRNTASNFKDYTVEGLKRQAAMGITRKRLIGMGWTDFDEIHYLYGMDAAGALTAVVEGRRQAYALSDYRSEIERGPVADVLTSRGSVGSIPVTRRTFLYHDLPWIEMEIRCTFDETVIDSYPEDADKLCVWWPYWYKDLITGGIPGGDEIPSRPEIAFLPVTWFDVDHMEARGGGLSIAYESVHKTFRRDNRIGTVLAWGDDRGHFSNHNMAMTWRSSPDLRLRGERVYRFFLYPRGRDRKTEEIPQWAMALQRQPFPYWTGDAGAEGRDLLRLEADGIVPTSIRRDLGGRMKIRFYEGFGRDASIDEVALNGKRTVHDLTDLSGDTLDLITPYRIGEITV